MEVISLGLTQDVNGLDRCLLGLRNHQGRYRGDKKIPVAYVTDSLQDAARIEESLHQHNLKTQSAVLCKAESKGKGILLSCELHDIPPKCP